MLIDLIELAANNALAHDRQAQGRLTQLQGKTMILEIKPFSQQLAMSPLPHGVELQTNPTMEADVTLRATINALVKIARDGMDDAELEAGELEISGDPIIGQRFARVLAELKIDWQGLLAEHIGETPAVLVSGGLEKAKEVADQSKVVFQELLNNILSNELELVASKDQVDPFLDQVDVLRSDTDRLSARIRRIQQKL